MRNHGLFIIAVIAVLFNLNPAYGQDGLKIIERPQFVKNMIAEIQPGLEGPYARIFAWGDVEYRPLVHRGGTYHPWLFWADNETNLHFVVEADMSKGCLGLVGEHSVSSMLAGITGPAAYWQVSQKDGYVEFVLSGGGWTDTYCGYYDREEKQWDCLNRDLVRTLGEHLPGCSLHNLIIPEYITGRNWIPRKGDTVEWEGDEGRPTHISIGMENFEGRYEGRTDNRPAWARMFGWGTGQYDNGNDEGGEIIEFTWFAWANSDANMVFEIDIPFTLADEVFVANIPELDRNRFWEFYGDDEMGWTIEVGNWWTDLYCVYQKVDEGWYCHNWSTLDHALETILTIPGVVSLEIEEHLDVNVDVKPSARGVW